MDFLLVLVVFGGVVLSLYMTYLAFYARHHASDFNPEKVERQVFKGFFERGTVSRILFVAGGLFALYIFFYSLPYAVDLILSGHPEGVGRFRPIKVVGGAFILLIGGYYYFLHDRE